jgi:hypothetical protein
MMRPMRRENIHGFCHLAQVPVTHLDEQRDLQYPNRVNFRSDFHLVRFQRLLQTHEQLHRSPPRFPGREAEIIRNIAS